MFLCVRIDNNNFIDVNVPGYSLHGIRQRRDSIGRGCQAQGRTSGK